MSKKKKKPSQTSRDRPEAQRMQNTPSFAFLLGGPSISKARAALNQGEALRAWEWFQCAEENLRPPDLEAAIQYQLGKDATGRGDWKEAEKHFGSAIRKHAAPIYQKRLALLRRRRPLLGDHHWDTMNASIDPATRLRPSELSPVISEVWACGAYYSRGGSKHTLLESVPEES